MRTRLLIVSALLAAAAGVAHTQPPPAVPYASPHVPTAPPRAEPPADKTVDQLLDRLEALRAQKAELERQEGELVKEIRRKAEKLGDRMQRLGVSPDGPVVPAAPAVSFAPPGIPVPPVPLPTAPR